MKYYLYISWIIRCSIPCIPNIYKVINTLSRRTIRINKYSNDMHQLTKSNKQKAWNLQNIII